jgi:multidrug efflux pump subunit AcrA (membrane-fusion protein)
MTKTAILNRIVIPSLAVVSLTYAGFATDIMRPRKQQVAPLSSPPERPFDQAVAAVGMIEPASELVQIGPRVPGWIASVHVRPNERVSAGQPLFTLDDTDLRAELALRHEGVAAAEARLERLRAMPRIEDVPIAQARVNQAQADVNEAHTLYEMWKNIADRSAVSPEELSQRQYKFEAAQGALEQAKAELEKLRAGAWKPDIAVAEQELAQARAAVARTQADVERLTVRAPIDGLILKLNARAGEYAPAGGAGQLPEPLVVMGSPPPWNVRVDINEEEAGKVVPAARAVAMPRGQAQMRIDMEFVRFEPYVVPKKTLSGYATERVDTRALQAIYRLTNRDDALFVGAQVDVYIERAGDLDERVLAAQARR